MRVKVKYRRGDAGYTVTGAAVPKQAPGRQPEAERWKSPPRYELRDPQNSEKVVSIRDQEPARKAEILPIRAGQSTKRNEDELSPAELVQGLTHILNPSSAFALALGLWRLGADLGITSEFAISDGPFSHWQVWMVAAAGMQLLGYSLRKRFRPAGDAAPQTE
jgi:hypothetical protein